MTFDWDDFHENNHRLDLLHQLKTLNPAFKCTLFAVPGLGSPDFWASVPEWCELAVHGWLHPDPYECQNWTYERTVKAILARPQGFTYGFKAPGWQISDATYRALLDYGWWVADQHLEDHRRPAGLRTYFYEDGNWHGHIQNVCGNGLEETWGEVSELVAGTQEFLFASEAVRVGVDADDSGAVEDVGGVPVER